MPVALQHMHEEEPNAAGADAHRVRRPVVDVAPPQEVRFQLGLRDFVGRLAVGGAVHSNPGMSLNEGGERPRSGDMLGSRVEGLE